MIPKFISTAQISFLNFKIISTATSWSFSFGCFTLFSKSTWWKLDSILSLQNRFFPLFCLWYHHIQSLKPETWNQSKSFLCQSCSHHHLVTRFFCVYCPYFIWNTPSPLLLLTALVYCFISSCLDYCIISWMFFLPSNFFFLQFLFHRTYRGLLN